MRSWLTPLLEGYARPRPGQILVQQLAQELGRGPDLAQLRLLHPGQCAHQVEDAVRQQIVGVNHGPAPPDGRRVQGHLQGAAAQQTPRPGLFQAAPKELAHLCMQHQLRQEMLQRTPCKRPPLHPQRYFPAQVHRGPAVPLGITHLAMCLQQQDGTQQDGWHAAPAIVPIVEGREVLIPKQLPQQPGQPPVQTVPTHQIQLQIGRFKQAGLI